MKMLKTTESAKPDYWLGFDLGGTKMLATIFDASFKPVVRKIGMEWMTLKIFRKVVATWTAQETHDPRVAQQMLGHKDLRTTEMYMGGGREARVLGVRAMEKRLGLVSEPETSR